MRIVSEARRPVSVRPRPRGASPHAWSAGPKAAPVLYLASEVARDALAAASAGAKADREQLGLLLGDAFVDRAGAPFAVAGALVSAPQDASRTHVRFTASRFFELAQSIERVPFDHLLVGWFHTHLGIGSRMSPTDVATQTRYFAAPHQVTWILDPVLKESRAFVRGPNGPAPAGVSVLEAPAAKLADFLSWKRPELPRTRTSNTSR